MYTAKKISIIAGSLGATVLFVSLLFVAFFGDIMTLYMEGTTGYEFAYKKWGDSFFNKSTIYDLSISDKSGQFSVRSEKTVLDVDVPGILKDRKVSLKCDAKNVYIEIEVAGNEFLLMAFNPDQKYADISFEYNDDGRTLELSDFNAASDKIKVSGGFSFDRKTDYVQINISISFSPEFVEKFPDIVKNSALSPDDEGWYGTVINLKGPAVILRAFYS